MSLREFAVLMNMCLFWGLHFIVIKLAVADLPPTTYAAVRMALVAGLLAPFLRWRPGAMGRIFVAGLCLGALNYAFLFNGLTRATASSSAVAVELYTPFATILSVLFLGETVGWRRIGGIALAFAGVVLIAVNGDADDAAGGSQTLGVAMVAAAVMFEAVGAVIIKRTEGFKPIEFLAWFGVIGFVFLTPTALIMEPGGFSRLVSADPWRVVGAVVYSAIGASIIGHTSYYWLIQRLPISLVAPSAFITTVIAVAASVVFLGEPFTPVFAIGGLMTMFGVGVILLRSNRAAPEPGARGAGFFRRRAGAKKDA
ncbi:MAG: DMT family transporter [Pseudomonadota bacterium]